MTTTQQDDKALALELAKYLPEELEIIGTILCWKYAPCGKVKDTEYLEIVHRIEKKLQGAQWIHYIENLKKQFKPRQLYWFGTLVHAPWHARFRAIIQTLGNPEPKKGE
jgi:hypothetical protein